MYPQLQKFCNYIYNSMYVPLHYLYIRCKIVNRPQFLDSRKFRQVKLLLVLPYTKPNEAQLQLPAAFPCKQCTCVNIIQYYLQAVYSVVYHLWQCVQYIVNTSVPSLLLDLYVTYIYVFYSRHLVLLPHMFHIQQRHVTYMALLSCTIFNSLGSVLRPQILLRSPLFRIQLI